MSSKGCLCHFLLLCTETPLGKIYLFEKNNTTHFDTRQFKWTNYTQKAIFCLLSYSKFKMLSTKEEVINTFQSVAWLLMTILLDSWALFIADKLEMYFFDSFSSHHKAQGESWIVLDKIIKNLTWPRIVFEGIRLYGSITELYWGQFQISCNTGLLTFWDLRFFAISSEEEVGNGMLRK